MSDLNRLRWRCRRGTLELDLMLLRYLDRCYQVAETQEQQAFIRLLEFEDSELIHYMMGDDQPTVPALAVLVGKIRGLRVDVAGE